MSDYKRFVSYLYEYIAEKKSDNRGFVKVELRSGICHMQFQLKVFSLPEHTSVIVYGFVLTENTLKGFQLGQLFSGKNGIIGQLSFPSQIPGTAYAVSDFNGLVLTAPKGKFYGTQWDETPISPKLFRPASQSTKASASASKTTAKPSAAPETPAISKPPQNFASETACKAEKAPDNSAASQSPPNNPAASPEDLPSQISQTPPAMQPQPHTPLRPQIPSPAQKRTPQLSQTLTAPENHTPQLSQTLAAPENHTPQNSEIPIGNSPESQSSETSAGLKIPGKSSSAAPAVPKNPATGLSGQNIRMTSAAAARQPDPWVWVQQRYTAIHPFDDDEISDCVRIMINDFPELRAHGFSVGCSQFIHHAFQSYHHLLLGRLISHQNTRYVLGVPGVYNANEQFIASMFGFNYFKPGRTPKECCCFGKTGYWYRPLT